MTRGRRGAAGVAAAWLFHPGPAAILVVALAAMLPELVAGLALSDSFVFNLSWTEQFRDLVRAGDPYPRWLPRSWDGAGSPTFYFYPPFFFWAAAALDALTLRMLPVSALVTLTSAAILAGSGLAMRAWLRDGAGAHAATVAAIAYMLTPWHLFDLYSRGSLAEAGAYLFVPAAMLGLRRLRDEQAGGLALLAAGYAGLILTHLPLALLASLAALPAYAAYLGFAAPGGRARFLGLAAAGGALGAALAAFYWVPALHLLGHTSADALSGPYFQPAAWFLWRLPDWPSEPLKWLVPPIGAAALLLAWAAGRAARGEARFWACLAALLVLLTFGVIPWFWQLPLVGQVQFPWRLLVLVDFAAITAVALVWRGLAAPAARAAGLPLAFAAAFVLLVVADAAGESWRRFGTEAASVRAGWRDAPEYLPRGTPLPLDEKARPLPVAIRPPAVPLAAADPHARVRAAPAPDGGLRVESVSPAATRIVVRRHFFPHWRVMDAEGRAVPVQAVDRLVSWIAPPGRHVWRVAHGPAPLERASLALSAGAFVLVLAGFAVAIARRRRGRYASQVSRLSGR